MDANGVRSPNFTFKAFDSDGNYRVFGSISLDETGDIHVHTQVCSSIQAVFLIFSLSADCRAAHIRARIVGAVGW